MLLTARNFLSGGNVRKLKTLAIYLAIALVLIVLAIFLLSQRALSARVAPHVETLAASTTAPDEAHRRLVTLGCADCHGADLAGKKFIDDPKLGVIWSSNLTQVAARATDQQLAQAIRQGIGHDGRSLIAMPAVQYKFLTDAEVTDVIRAVRAMPRVGEDHPGVSLGPVGRIGMAMGKFNTQPVMLAADGDKAPADLGDATALGRHLVATHCTDCHGRDVAGFEPMPEVKAPDLDIAGAYDLPAFEKLLDTGIKADGKKAVLMGDVSPISFRMLTPAEKKAIHDYLVARASR